MLFRLWLICAPLLLLGVSAESQAPGIRKVHIVERGTYRAETVARTNTPGTTGLINTVQNAELIHSTTSIPGIVGVRFGMRYVVTSDPASGAVPLRLVIRFPPTGLRNPATGEMFFQNEHNVSVPTGARLYWEYHFEHQWEVAEGIWQFEFWEGSKRLGEQRFCVYDPSRLSVSESRAE